MIRYKKLMLLTIYFFVLLSFSGHAQNLEFGDELTINLKDARLSTHRKNTVGWTLKKIYTLSDDRKIIINFSWTSTGICKEAVAKTDSGIISEAKLVNFFKSENFTIKHGMKVYNKNTIEVEEYQYYNGNVIYKALLKFSWPYSKKKISEWPIKGRKKYEIFREWE